MTDHSQHDETHNEPGENAAPSKMGSIRIILKRAAHYAMLGFAPVVAIIALIVAAMAVSANRSSQAQLSAAMANLDTANAALKTSKTELGNLKAELNNLKAELAQHKTQQEKENKNQEALTGKIVQGVSRLQIKMKISPTLEEQLQQNASAPVAAPSAASAPVAPASAAPDTPRKTSSQVQAIKDVIEKFNKK